MIAKPKITMVPVDELTVHPQNPRQGDVSAIVESIKAHGVYGVLVVQRSTGHVMVGNHRLKAARAMGIEKLPVEYRDCDDAEALRILLNDNKTSDLASYDDNMLAELLTGLVNDDMLDGSGFSGDDLDELLASLQQDEPAKDIPAKIDQAAELQKKWATETGQAWAIGKHRLMCGDSTNADDVAKLLDGQAASLIHADPPYGMGKEKDGVVNDNLYRDKLDAFQMEWWRTCRPHIEDNASVYIWGNAEGLWRLWYAGGLSNSEPLTLRNEIVWDKGHGIGIKSDTHRIYPTVTERCLFFILGEQGFNTNSDNYWEGWEPIRSYLEKEMRRCGWTVADLNRITETQMGSHWVTRSQWVLTIAEHYDKIQKAARGHGAFKRQHDELKRQHDELKREFYATRAYFNNTHENMTDVWQFDRVIGDERHGHATPKPVKMIARCIKSSAPNGGLVYDPFLGSGTTMVAAEQLGRKCFGLEISANYTAVCLQRMADMGLEPVLT